MSGNTNKNLIISFMMRKLSGCKYCYRSTVEGCFAAAVENYGFNASENKEEVIDEVILMLKAFAEENK